MNSAHSKAKVSQEFTLDETLLEQFKQLPVVGPIKYKTDNSTYKGQMVNDKRHGKGVLI